MKVKTVILKKAVPARFLPAVAAITKKEIVISENEARFLYHILGNVSSENLIKMLSQYRSKEYNLHTDAGRVAVKDQQYKMYSEFKTILGS